MKVSRKVLIENSRSFKVELSGERWEEAHQNVVDMEADSLAATEIAMRVLHGAVVESSYKIRIFQIWELVQYCQYRHLKVELFEEWFTMVLPHVMSQIRDEKPDARHKVMRQMLFPAYVFNHSAAFAHLTKTLALEVASHITEDNPTHYYGLHLPQNVIGKFYPKSETVQILIA